MAVKSTTVAEDELTAVEQVLLKEISGNKNDLDKALEPVERTHGKASARDAFWHLIDRGSIRVEPGRESGFEITVQRA